MNVAFDTLKYANDLKKCGMPEKQAEGMAKVQAKVLAEAMENNLATKQDITDLRSEMKDVRSEIKSLDDKMEKLVSIAKADIFKWGVSVLFVHAAFVITLIKLIK